MRYIREIIKRRRANPQDDLVSALARAEETVAVARRLAEAAGKVVSMVRDTPGTYGFLLNRIFAVARREAQAIVDAGIATPEDIDKAMITGRNWPAGFFGARGGIGREW